MDRASPDPLNKYLALFAATLFCVHTVNTETMNLMHARSEILSALGIVCGFLVYVGAPRLRRLQLHLLPMAAGALAKTPAVLLAPLLFVWEFLAPWSPPSRAGVCRPTQDGPPGDRAGFRGRARALLVRRKEDGAADPRLRWRRPPLVRPDPGLGLAALPPAVRPARWPLGGHGPLAHPLVVRHARRSRARAPSRRLGGWRCGARDLRARGP